MAADPYRAQADRLRLLGRQSAPDKATRNGLALEASTSVQPEFNRPPATVNAFVQKHYGLPQDLSLPPAPPPEGVGMPAAGSAAHPVELRRVAQERGMAAAAHRRLERSAAAEQAHAAKVRIDLARQFSLKVAVSNAKVLLAHSPPAQQQQVPPLLPQSVPSADGGDVGVVASPVAAAAAATSRRAAAGPSPHRKQLSVVDQLALERRPEVRAAVAGHVPRTAPAPAQVPAPASPAVPDQPGSMAAVEHEAGATALATGAASSQARKRLLLHCSTGPLAADAATAAAAAAAAAGPGGLAAQGQGSASASASPQPLSSTLGYPQAPRARRALQPIQPAAGLSPEQQQQQQLAQRVAKNYKGRPLPLAVSASDLAGLQRIANKVKEQGIALPSLCPCKAAGMFDAGYTTKCCHNCPLYGNPTRYAELLTFVLRNADVI